MLPGMREMHTAHGCKLYAHSAETERIAKQIMVGASDLSPLTQGTVLPLGEAGGLRVLHTPGHSAGSVCLAVEPKSSAKPVALIVGDTIFPGSCGRLDLPDSDIDRMFESLQILRGLDDSITVYPGHGYSGPSTTIGKEKTQGLLRPFTRDMWRGMHG